MLRDHFKILYLIVEIQAVMKRKRASTNLTQEPTPTREVFGGVLLSPRRQKKRRRKNKQQVQEKRQEPQQPSKRRKGKTPAEEELLREPAEAEVSRELAGQALSRDPAEEPPIPGGAARRYCELLEMFEQKLCNLFDP